MYEIGKAEIENVRKVIESGQTFRYRGGEGGWCDKFEAALARKIGVKHALATSSGTGALACAMVGAGLGPGDEVIVPAYTFMASALAVLMAGAVPIIAEVGESLMIDPKDVERKITRHTKAIMPVHMMGHLCDMKSILAIARKHKLMVIEDACQAVGGSYQGRRAGSIGKAGAFSFNYFKNMTCGEGGAVLTSDGVIFDRARIYHDGGCVFRQYASEIETPFFTGSNFRVSEIQGAILSAQLERLDGILKRLRARFKAMNEVLAKSKRFALSPLNDAEGDCGSSVLVTFEKEAEAKAYLDRHQNHGTSVGRPIDTGRHVYCNWEPIMNRRGAHHAKLNPYNWAKREIRYAADMCPRSLDLMSRTVFASVPYKASIGEARRLAKALAE